MTPHDQDRCGRGVSRPELVDINSASRDELMMLPDISEARADAIISNRPFKAKEDVMRVKGIKEGRYGNIKDLIEAR